MPKSIAIVGYGFVGKAVEHGFTCFDNKLQLIDPNLGTDVNDVDPDTDASFVSYPHHLVKMDLLTLQQL